MSIEHAITHLTGEYLKKKFPWTPRANYSLEQARSIKKKYRSWIFFTYVIVFLCFILLPFFYGALCYYIYIFIYKAFIISGNVGFYPAEWYVFTITGLALMAGTINWWVKKIQQLFLASDYEEFEDYYNTRQQYDNNKMGVFLGKIFCIIALATLPFTFSTRVITNDESVSYRFFTDVSAKTYLYKTIEHINYYTVIVDTKGNVSNDSVYEIVFNDGTIFYPGKNLGPVDKVQPFIDDVIRHSGLAVDTAGAFYAAKRNH